MYWGITAMHLLRSINEIDRDATIKFILACQHEDGVFSSLK